MLFNPRKNCLVLFALTALSIALGLSFQSSLRSEESGYDVYTYVSDYWQHRILIFRNLVLVGKIVTSGESAGSVDITADNRRLYTTNNISNSVCVLDVEPGSRTYGKEVASIKIEGLPISLKIHPEGSKAYVASGNQTVIIDTDPASPTYNQVIKSIPLDRYGAFDLDFSPGGDFLFVVHQGGPPANIAVIDTLEDKLVDIDSDASNGVTRMSVGQGIGGSAFFRAIRIGPNGYGYVLNTGKGSSFGAGNVISVFDSATFTPIDIDDDPMTTTPGEPEGITSIIIPGTLPVALWFSPDGARLYVSQRDTTIDATDIRGKILLVDADPSSPTFNRVVKVTEAGVRPEGVGVWPDGRYVFVSCRMERVIRVFDARLKPVTTLPIQGGYPGQMVSVKRPKQVSLAK